MKFPTAKELTMKCYFIYIATLYIYIYIALLRVSCGNPCNALKVLFISNRRTERVTWKREVSFSPHRHFIVMSSVF